MDSEYLFYIWRKALDSYVLQSVKPTSLYHFQDQLGRGSHAKVFLATPHYPDEKPEPPECIKEKGMNQLKKSKYGREPIKGSGGGGGQLQSSVYDLLQKR